jgi:hypothetical protein
VDEMKIVDITSIRARREEDKLVKDLVNCFNTEVYPKMTNQEIQQFVKFTNNTDKKQELLMSAMNRIKRENKNKYW